MFRLINELVTSVRREIWVLNDQLSTENRRSGGYLSVIRIDKGVSESTPFFVVQVGNPSKEKLQKYFRLCQEKSLRLSANPNHVSGWQSRDCVRGKYGGAIRTQGYILAFSGLVEMADEAVLVNSAFKLGMITGQACAQILRISGNSLIQI